MDTTEAEEKFAKFSLNLKNPEQLRDAMKKLNPYESLQCEVRKLLLTSSEISEEELQRLISNEIPRKWERHGDLIVIPQNSLRDTKWSLLGDKLYQCICNCLKVSRVARKNPVKSDQYRSSNLELLWGNNAIVTHVDNKIKYQWDLTKCMFSIGNITEKLRIAKFNCLDEVVVDLFAGIGYFVLPYLVHAKAKHVYACEINPNSIAALKQNLKANGVENYCTVLEGDNRETCPTNIADRVNLGLIPSSEISWKTSCKALKNDKGGYLHIHANIDSRGKTNSVLSSKQQYFKYPEWEEWTNATITSIDQLLQEVKGRKWNVKMLHLEHVKSYAPHVDHVVLDLDCRPLN